MVVMPTRSIVDTTWSVSPDVSRLITELKAAKTVKTQLRLFFIGEDHYHLFDQQRRKEVAARLKQMGKTAQPIYTVVERGLDVDTDDLENVLQEDSGMHASHAQRNVNVSDSIIEVLMQAHTVPDVVFLFGANHEAGIVAQLVTDINDRMRLKELPEKTITELAWRSWRPIDTWVAGEPANVSWQGMVKETPGTLLGYVEYDQNCIDHNMLLAEKCVVKTSFFMRLRGKDMISTGNYWAVHAAKDSLARNTVRDVRSETYVDETKLEIRSVNPSLIVRAYRK